MVLRAWEDFPEIMKTSEVKEYYDILIKRKNSLRLKRGFDIITALLLLIILSPFILILSVLIILDSPGKVFYRQERITAYGKKFRIHKFRTMVENADKFGSQVTIREDKRITKIGKTIRKYRLDEIPQLLDILKGDMSFVGTRPEVPKYVEQYTKEMYATLILPAGITSEASMQYKDEAELLDHVQDVDKVYVEQILPQKMQYNLKAIREFRFWNDVKTMLRTVSVVIGKE